MSTASPTSSTSSTPTFASSPTLSPDSMKRQPQPSASTNQVPTVGSLKNFKRSVSYNIHKSVPEEDAHAHTTSPTGWTLDEAGCNQMMKASLTGLLNCQEVKSGARERTVQNMLMNTERDLRRARRASLRTGALSAKRSANTSPDIASRPSKGSLDMPKGDK
ncbi:uncharacterized protein BDW70DRAFT_142206 [Aspergillus foveolatus]|uniref:uncharacterized protein n=1 Tax=Aspergillus foveolatus TaxID=210207 RepID=UPI003CCCAFAA